MVVVACLCVLLSDINFLTQLCGYVPKDALIAGSYAVTDSGTILFIDGIITATLAALPIRWQFR